VEPRVPETRAARALVWAGIAAAALAFAAPPGAPGALAWRTDTEQCRLAPARAGGIACGCAGVPFALREVLGLPAPLDTTDEADLARIPGLGRVRAAAIARERAAHGPFATVDQLAARVPGIGAKTVDRIRPRVFASGPDPACGGVGRSRGSRSRSTSLGPVAQQGGRGDGRLRGSPGD
jgi:competence ComEA-like helix-hairpin-helix protein